MDRVVGMYAFAIWYDEELFLARDQLGVKPLFYASLPHSKEFVFASEMSVLLCHPAIRSDVPSSKLETMLAMMIVRMPGNVPFNNVEELLPAHFVRVKKEVISVTKYWDLSSTCLYSNMDDAAQVVQNLLREAVSSQIVSDVPFGCLLSGGIDSTTVTHFLSNCIASKANDCNALHTFSLQLPEYQQHFQVRSAILFSNSRTFFHGSLFRVLPLDEPTMKCTPNWLQKSIQLDIIGYRTNVKTHRTGYGS